MFQQNGQVARLWGVEGLRPPREIEWPFGSRVFRVLVEIFTGTGDWNLSLVVPPSRARVSTSLSLTFSGPSGTYHLGPEI